MSDATADAITVESLAEEFLERKRRGEQPTVAEYVARYPHLADEIRDVFPVLGLVEDFKPGSGDATGTFAGAEIPGLEKPLERLGDLPHPARGRPGWHGGGLRGRAGIAGPARGAEGDGRPPPERPHAPRPVRPRGQGRRAAAPHEHRAGVRRRRGGGRSLLRHAVHPGPGARCRPERVEAAGSGPGGPRRARRPNAPATSRRPTWRDRSWRASSPALGPRPRTIRAFVG